MIAKSPDLPVKSQSLRHVDDYLEVGQKAGASDIHLAANAQPRWRLHGCLEPIWPDAPLLTAEETTALAEAFMPSVYKNELHTRGDSDFAYQNEFARYRTSVVRQRLGLELVFRVINTHVRTIDELGLPERLKLLTRYQNGLSRYPTRDIHSHRLVRHSAARFTSGRSRCDHGWRNARFGNDFTRHHGR